MRVLLLLAGVLPAAAQACPGEVFMACTFSEGRKAVEVCHVGDRVTYAYGPPGRMDDLRLSVPVAEVEIVPWPGIGRAIWEEITFRNGDTSYLVYGNIDRIYPETEDGEIVVVVSGGIVVSEGDKELAHLTCDPDSVDFPWSSGIHDAKAALGLCFDRHAGGWAACAE